MDRAFLLWGTFHTAAEDDTVLSLKLGLFANVHIQSADGNLFFM